MSDTTPPMKEDRGPMTHRSVPRGSILGPAFTLDSTSYLIEARKESARTAAAIRLRRRDRPPGAGAGRGGD